MTLRNSRKNDTSQDLVISESWHNSLNAVFFFSFSVVGERRGEGREPQDRSGLDPQCDPCSLLQFQDVSPL